MKTKGETSKALEAYFSHLKEFGDRIPISSFSGDLLNEPERLEKISNLEQKALNAPNSYKTRSE